MCGKIAKNWHFDVLNPFNGFFGQNVEDSSFREYFLENFTKIFFSYFPQILTYDAILAPKLGHFDNFLIVWTEVEKNDPFKGYFGQNFPYKSCSERCLDDFENIFLFVLCPKSEVWLRKYIKKNIVNFFRG